MAHPVTHFEVNAKDPKAQQSFYAALFGWGIDTNNPMSYGMVDTRAAGAGIAGGIGGSQDGRSWITFYVETSDLAATLAKAEQLGGKTVMPPTDLGMVHVALFADPEGNVIGLAKGMQAPPRKPAPKKAVARKAVKRTPAKKAAKKAATRKKAAKKAPTRKTAAKHPARRARGRRS